MPVTPPSKNRPRTRTPTPGPELELVKGFAARLPIKPRAGARLDLFMEPYLPTGYPDLVAVMWRPSITLGWSPTQRRDIGADSLKLLHYLGIHGPLTLETICRHHRAPGASLEKLAAANLVYRRGSRWCARSRRRSFAVRNIVAFEAKTSGRRDVFYQAAQNTWFASESYVLLPRHPRASSISLAKKLSVGIWVDGCRRPSVPAPRFRNQPLSYGSWLFNEWVFSQSRDSSAVQAQASH